MELQNSPLIPLAIDRNKSKNQKTIKSIVSVIFQLKYTQTSSYFNFSAFYMNGNYNYKPYEG